MKNTRITITDSREIASKSKWIGECRTAADLAPFKQAIRDNGGERFDGELALVAHMEKRIAARGGSL